MGYIDYMVYSARPGSKDAIIEFAERMDCIFLELGATRIVEAWGDDVPHGQNTDFHRAVAATEGETVVVGHIEWPDKPTRDAAMESMRTDPRMQEPMPFDGKRMIYGGFLPVIDLKA